MRLSGIQVFSFFGTLLSYWLKKHYWSVIGVNCCLFKSISGNLVAAVFMTWLFSIPRRSCLCPFVLEHWEPALPLIRLPLAVLNGASVGSYGRCSFLCFTSLDDVQIRPYLCVSLLLLLLGSFHFLVEALLAKLSSFLQDVWLVLVGPSFELYWAARIILCTCLLVHIFFSLI